MTTTLLYGDPAMLALILACWTWAATRVTSLPYAASARAMTRETRGVLALIGVGVVLTLLRAGQVAALAPARWSLAQDKLLLSLLVSTAVVAVALPRLFALRAASRAFHGVTAMPPALRHAAADPLLAWPVQVTAFAAVGELVFYPATWWYGLCVVAGVALAAAVSWSLLGRRHRRFGMDVVAVPRRPVRIVRRTATVVALCVIAATVGLVAVVATAPASAGIPD